MGTNTPGKLCSLPFPVLSPLKTGSKNPVFGEVAPSLRPQLPQAAYSPLPAQQLELHPSTPALCLKCEQEQWEPG